MAAPHHLTTNNSPAHLRLVVAEEDVELVVTVTREEFQQLVRIAFTSPRATVADVIRDLVADALAGWTLRLRESS